MLKGLGPANMPPNVYATAPPPLPNIGATFDSSMGYASCYGYC